MELKPIGRIELKPIAPSKFARLNQCAEFITVREKDIRINDKLYERLLYADYVVVAIDEQMKMLGIKATTQDDKWAYQVKPGESGGAVINGTRPIVEALERTLPNWDKTASNVRIVSGKADDEYIIFDLDRAEIILRRKYTGDK